MDKIQNLHDLKYYTNMNLVTELALKWSKARPNNKEIQALSKSLTDIAFYVIRVQEDLAQMNAIKAEYDNVIQAYENKLKPSEEVFDELDKFFK